MIERVGELSKTLDDEQIAATLNREGLKTNKGNVFTIKGIQWIRHKHNIQPVDDKKAEELTVKEVSARFAVSPGVVYDWITKGLIQARRRNAGSPYLLTISPEFERELANRTGQSKTKKPQ